MATMKTPIAVLLSGTGSNMAALLYNSRRADCPYEIVLVASNKPDAPGLTLAAAEGIATFAHDHRGHKREDFDRIMDAAVRDSGAELIVLAGYMRILSPWFVESWSGRLLNIHPSLLPLYPGLDTHARAIDAGDSHGGCTVHIVTEELDAGPVLGQTRVAILPGDDADSLAKRVLVAEHQLYPRCVEAFVTRDRNPDRLLERLRAHVHMLPDTSERLSHGANGWRVGSDKTGKFFAFFAVDHYAEKGPVLIVKTSGIDEQQALVESDPATYYRPAQYGPRGWIAIRLDKPGLDWQDVTGWLDRSWAMVAPARLARLAHIADAF